MSELDGVEVEGVPWWTAVLLRRIIPGCGEVIGVQWWNGELVLVGRLGAMVGVFDPSIDHVGGYVIVEKRR